MEKPLPPEEAAFVERLNAAIDRAGGATKVAPRSGVAVKTIYNWRTGVNATAALALHRIAKGCGISLDQLFGSSTIAGSGTEIPDLATYVDIPILDVVAAAGGGAENDQPNVIGRTVFARASLRNLGISPAKVIALRASGDSMFPTIADGQMVLINTDTTDLKDGAIYAIWAPHGLRLKRIQLQMDGGMLLISDNRELYTPEHIAAREANAIRFVGRAFWTERLI
ncbi:LexA family transcriptional regulator [Phreatobacter stygius]|uniref:HTH cro/C1-type domain-containing protein n=1 Tax=Phreatobacter stygius TaxID=1940610 RepID=A0A4D7B2Y1_9HYPH|nr:S24 family peptidase [Phreatobacter stygius]QCI65665.1 hypothetical protein E8M01_16485 [Phreatobacter stygius]